MVQDVKTHGKMEETTNMGISFNEKAVRYQGKWYKIVPKQYESERQSTEIGWSIIKENITSLEAYRNWYSKEREDAKLLYPSFRKSNE